MIHIYSCHDYSIVKSVKTPAEANKVLLGPPAKEGYCMFAQDSEGRICGDCESGYTGRSHGSENRAYEAGYAYACGYRD